MSDKVAKSTEIIKKLDPEYMQCSLCKEYKKLCDYGNARMIRTNYIQILTCLECKADLLSGLEKREEYERAHELI